MSVEETGLAVARLYRAIVTNDVDAAAGFLREDAFIGVPGHEGSGVRHLADLLRRLHVGEFRTWSTDSADVLVSDFHGVVLDRWLSERVGEQLDQHVTVVAADRDEDGRFGILSIYGYDTAAVAGFFDGG